VIGANNVGGRRQRLSFFFTATLGLLMCVPQVSKAGGQPYCMDADKSDEIVGGLLKQGTFKDATGRPEVSYILTLPEPTCLRGHDEDDNVSPSKTIQLYSSDTAIDESIRRFVGKRVMVTGRPFGAATAHHHAPIVMDISEIDLP
jgi:hypothetical protein